MSNELGCAGTSLRLTVAPGCAAFLVLTGAGAAGALTILLLAAIRRRCSCPGHRSAAGMRVYFDAADRASSFIVDLGDD